MKMNLGDPELELIDPTPNVHSLFIHFDKLFFWTKLASRAVVRWSKRMYSCAGVCSYDRGGLCDIALSEPLLKLRPRKDLIETLLHEMIHAFLFITNRDRDRDGHGPNFQAHMHRINRCAGLNISIYHNFHEEVQLYQTHWWRCDGPCQTRRPYFGIVRRSANRAPGPTDYWWKNHQNSCGGTFIKIKEPEKQVLQQKSTKSKGDITKYIDKNSKNVTNKVTKPVLKDSNNIKTINTIKNNNNTIVVSKKNVVFNPQPTRPLTPFTGPGHTLNASSGTTSGNVAETVKNIWANKQISPSINSKVKNSNNNRISLPNLSKTKAGEHDRSPPKKIMRIDDYFKSSVKSVLKDIYEIDFEIKEITSNNQKRLSVVSVETELVSCPVCNTKINNIEINKHLDECLNTEVVENLSKEVIETYNEPSTSKSASSHTLSTNKKNESIEQSTNNSNVSIGNINNSIKIEKKYSIENELISIKVEPTASEEFKTLCPCCEKSFDKSIEDHLDECLAVFGNNNAATSVEVKSNIVNETIVIDDELDESQIYNETGTKFPCPCCLEMFEEVEMNNHLNVCLS